MAIVNIGFSEFLEDNVKEITDKFDWMKTRTFKLCKTIEEFKEFIDEAIKNNLCVLDLESNGLSTRTKKVDDKIVSVTTIVGFCLCYDTEFATYVPINHREDSECNLPEKEVLNEIKRLCVNCRVIFHNAKYDIALLRNYGIIISDYKMFEDTIILGRLYDAGTKETGLKKLSEKLLNQPMLELKDVTGGENKFDLISPNVGYIYGGSDAICTFDLYKFFEQQDIIKQQEFIYNLEKRVVFVVIEMESHLIKINTPYLLKVREKADKRVEELTREIYELVGHEFNIGSPLQLGRILFDELEYEYPQKRKTATGQYITDDKTMKKIAEKYPLVQKILEFRNLGKLTGTYIKKLLLNTDEEGFVKLGFNQVGTDTGRFSSPGGAGLEVDGYSGVNFQSMPKKPDKKNPELDLRKALTVRDSDKTMVAIDYENEEMRVATNLSRETVWIESIKKGVDFHTATGALVSGKNVEDITPDSPERRIGKCVAKGTRIASENGWIPIENLKVGDKVITHRGDLKKITKIWNMGTKPGIKIQTKTGLQITCGLNHRFKNTSDKWIRAEDLKVGDKLKTISCHKMNPKKIQKIYFNIWNKGNENDISDNLPIVEITPMWARLLGYILGMDVKEDILNTCHKLGLSPLCKLEKRRFKKDGTLSRPLYQIHIGSRILVRFFRELGFTGRREWKEENAKLGRYKSVKIFRVPRIIFESPKNVSREFLRGLFETDGYVSPKKEVSVTTKDKQFAEDIQLLLLQFGIKTSIYRTFSKKYNRYYYSIFCSVSGAKIFEKKINFISKEKRDRLYRITHNKAKKYSSSGSFKIKWEAEVREIESLNEVELMDLTIEHDHTYVAEGLITHNTVNFLSLYLGGPYNLSEQAGVSISEAKRILTTYFSGVPRLKKWMEREIARSHKSKIVKTVFGRIRPLHVFYESDDRKIISHGDRCVVNTLIQGSSADIMKIVMAKLHAWIHRNNFQDDIKILITMHDELVFEITTKKLHFLIPEIVKIMMLKDVVTKKLNWEVPLTVDVKYGDNWRVEKNFFEDFPELKKEVDSEIYESKPVIKQEKSEEQTEKLKYVVKQEKSEEQVENTESHKKKLEEEISVEEKIESDNTNKVESLQSDTEITTETYEQEKSHSGILTTDKYLVYEIKNRDNINLRWLNDILTFFIKDKNGVYQSPKKILKLKDTEGNSLLVSEFEVPVDAFLALVRFFGV